MNSKARVLRKILMAAAALALVATWTPTNALANTGDCWETEQYGGLFCNDGSMMEVCDLGDGQCSIDCGQGTVGLSCIEPE